MTNDFRILDSDGKFFLEMVNFNLDSSYKGNPHTHHYLEISYIKNGTGIYYIDDRVYDILPGDVFLFNNVEEHLITLDSSDCLVNLVIHFEPRFIWSQLDNSFDSRYLQIFFNRKNNFSNRLDRNNPASKKIAELFLEIQEEFQNAQHGYELMVKVRLLNILVLMARCYDYSWIGSDKIHNIHHGIDALNEVLDYIDGNLDRQITLEELAKVAHMNTSYFSTFFKKYNGMNPSKYIMSKKIQLSVEYLKFTDKTILEISNLCGFNNLTSFYTAFKKVTSCTPSDYRK